MKLPVVASFLPLVIISIAITAVTVVIFATMHHEAINDAMERSIKDSLAFVEEKISSPLIKLRSEVLILREHIIMKDIQCHQPARKAFNGSWIYPTVYDEEYLIPATNDMLIHLSLAKGLYSYVYQSIRKAKPYPHVPANTTDPSHFPWGDCLCGKTGYCDWAVDNDYSPVMHFKWPDQINYTIVDNGPYDSTGFPYNNGLRQIKDTAEDADGRWVAHEVWKDIHDGSLTAILSYAAPVAFDANGHVVNTVGIDMDMTWTAKFLENLNITVSEVTIMFPATMEVLATSYPTLNPGFRKKDPEVENISRSEYELWRVGNAPEPRIRQAVGALQAHLGNVPLGEIPDGPTLTNPPDSEFIFSAQPIRGSKLNLLIVIVTEKSFYFNNGDVARIEAIVISSALICVMVGCTVLNAVLLTKPLKVLGNRMAKTAALEDDGEDAIAMSFLAEIAEMQEAYQGMKFELGRLKSYIPQSLLVGHRPSSDSSRSTATSNGFSQVVMPDVSASGTLSTATSAPKSSNIMDDEEDEEEDGSSTIKNPLKFQSASETGTPPLFTAIRHGKPTIEGHERQGMVVNEAIFSTEMNRFSIRRCTVVAIEVVGLPTGDPMELGEEVHRALETIVKRAIDAGGVIETMTPDSMCITFNSHFSCLMHEERAVNFALKILKASNSSPIWSSLFVAIDTTDCCVGTIGAHGRRSRVVMGESLDCTKRLLPLIRAYIPTHIIVTERCARGVSGRSFALVDTICPNWIQSDRAKLIHLAVPAGLNKNTYATEALFTTAHKAAYSKLMRGDIAQALELWQDIEDSARDPHILRLIRECRRLQAAKAKGAGSPTPKIFASPHRRKEAVQWESNGDPLWCDGDEEHHSSVHHSGLIGRGASSHTGPSASSSQHQAAMSAVDALAASESVFDDGPLGDDGEEERRDSAPLISLSHNPEVDPGDSRSTKSSLKDGSSSFGGGADPAAGLDGDDVVDINKVVFDVSGVEWTRADEPLAKGAFGDVYQGMSSNGVLSAIKVLRTNNRTFDVGSLKKEIQLLCRLRHENIVHYVSVAADGSRALFIIMELVVGGSLMDVCDRFGSLKEGMVRRFTVDILKGLHYLHTQGVVHCDVKPHNVLLSQDGVVKLADFGSAVNYSRRQKIKRAFSANDESLIELDNGSGSENSSRSRDLPSPLHNECEGVFNLRGTTWYMAPEVARGDEPTSASDVWSLGITILQLLQGELPWSPKQRHNNNEMLFLRDLGKGTLIPDAIRDTEHQHVSATRGAAVVSITTTGLDGQLGSDTSVTRPGTSSPTTNLSQSQRTISSSVSSELLAAVKRCLQVDPACRPSCQELLDADFAL